MEKYYLIPIEGCEITSSKIKTPGIFTKNKNINIRHELSLNDINAYWEWHIEAGLVLAVYTDYHKLVRALTEDRQLNKAHKYFSIEKGEI